MNHNPYCVRYDDGEFDTVVYSCTLGHRSDVGPTNLFLEEISADCCLVIIINIIIISVRSLMIIMYTTCITIIEFAFFLIYLGFTIVTDKE